ncbi:MAG: TatD family hydrolase [Streptosporangiaceae bacterium]
MTAGVLSRPVAPDPEPLPAAALDSHCHLDMMGAPVAQVLSQAARSGISRFVTVGTDVPSSAWAADCAAEHDSVVAAVAVHPNGTADAAAGPGGRDGALARIAALAALPRVRAVGETGLDYYRDSAPPRVQQDWFRAHIEIARATGKALMIHDREAHEDVLAILAAVGAPEHVIFHCFSGDAAMARKCAAAGYVLSFAGTLTFANAPGLREAAAVMPPELVLVETDAPYLAPAPNRGKRNAPAQAAHTLRALAAAQGREVADMCGIVSRNAERVFGSW